VYGVVCIDFCGILVSVLRKISAKAEEVKNMIENKELQLMLHELRCREDELACQKNAQLSLEKDIECQIETIVHLKTKIASSKINC
jgi:hypothetical protein